MTILPCCLHADIMLPCSGQGYAFAQSVKLAVFEKIVDAAIEKVPTWLSVEAFQRGDDRSQVRPSPSPKLWRSMAPSTWTRSWLKCGAPTALPFITRLSGAGRQMGAIFVTKCSMTLQSDMLGTPDAGLDMSLSARQFPNGLKLHLRGDILGARPL